jgi:hypothetical protein
MMEEESHEFGKGGFGKVSEIVDLDTLQVRAAKHIPKPLRDIKPSQDPFFQELWAYHNVRQAAEAEN